jgi:hypothetical protein
MTGIIIRHSEKANFRKVTCDCKQPADCDSDICHTHSIAYLLGKQSPNFPVPAIPLIHQWDFSLWVLLETMPPMTDEEWEREENEWQDYLDNLDNPEN